MKKNPIKNIDAKTVDGFGYEWTKFDQSVLSEIERNEIFASYFSIFPWNSLPANAQGFDLGCGSGRWAACIAPKVGLLYCIDASSAALNTAKKNLAGFENCRFHNASVSEIPLADTSMDFGYSLGVLHHIPDTSAGIKACVAKLKIGAPFLLYLYYRFDNKPLWFKALWFVSDLMRKFISRAPYFFRYQISQFLAAMVYYPLARSAFLLEKMGFRIDSFPLSIYRMRSFYVMRTDAFDRFCTQLEHRFTREEIKSMMENAGLVNVVFSPKMPYWCALGIKK